MRNLVDAGQTNSDLVTRAVMPDQGRPRHHRFAGAKMLPDFPQQRTESFTRASAKEKRSGSTLRFGIPSAVVLILIWRWCPGAESNHRHCDFQSHALPTELPGPRSHSPNGVGGGCLAHARTRIKRQPNAGRVFVSRRVRRWRRVLVQFRRRSRNPINPGQPTPKVNLLTPWRTKWPGSLRRRAPADRACG